MCQWFSLCTSALMQAQCIFLKSLFIALLHVRQSTSACLPFSMLCVRRKPGFGVVSEVFPALAVLALLVYQIGHPKADFHP